MTKTRLLLLALFISASTVATLAQISTATPAARPAQPGPAVAKIAFINAETFYDEKVGILKLVNALKQLEREFAPKNQELTSMNARMGAIATELQNMQKLPPAQFNQAAFEARREEGENLKRKFDYEKTVAETDAAKRRSALVSPISQEVLRAMDEYAKRHGFNVVLDPSKLSEAMLYYVEAADSTKDFITFFNAKAPVTPATTPR